MIKITLSHPHGNANSYHAALALEEQHWLSSFQTGLINKNGARRWTGYLPASVKQRSLNRSYDRIPESNQRAHVVWEIVSRIGNRIKPKGLTSRVNWYDVLFYGHDLQVSKVLENNLDAVYAYEDAARRTFTAARQ